MGNRAVITTKDKKIGVYLHWNGGRDSVEAFLKYCEFKGYRPPETDCYGWARLCQVIGNFFGGSTSIGIDEYNRLDTDNWDNGVYVIENWKIVDRLFLHGEEQNEYDLNEMLADIDKSQPTDEQLGDFLKAKEVDISELKVGDIVYVSQYGENYVKQAIIGFGEDEFVNGTNVKGLPIVGLYNGNTVEDCKGNINNYIRQEKIRVER